MSANCRPYVDYHAPGCAYRSEELVADEKAYEAARDALGAFADTVPDMILWNVVRAAINTHWRYRP